MKKKDGRRMISIVGGVFLTVGVIALVVSIIVTAMQVSFWKNAEKTEAYIERIDMYQKSTRTRTRNKRVSRYSYYVYVSYEVDGVSYDNVHLGYHSPGMTEGQSITIYYNPDDPAHIKAKGGAAIMIGLPWIFAVVFSAVGGVMLLTNRRFSAKKHLRETGKCYKLPIAKIGLKTNIRVNGVPAYYIICQGEDPITGNRQIYTSGNYYDAAFDVRYQVGDIVPVYVDPSNSENYFVDVENIEIQKREEESYAGK